MWRGGAEYDVGMAAPLTAAEERSRRLVAGHTTLPAALGALARDRAPGVLLMGTKGPMEPK